MDKFLNTQKLSRLNHEKIENLNRPVMSKEIESVIKNIPTKKNSEPDDFTGEIYQAFTEKSRPSLLKLFEKI